MPNTRKRSGDEPQITPENADVKKSKGRATKNGVANVNKEAQNGNIRKKSTTLVKKGKQNKSKKAVNTSAKLDEEATPLQEAISASNQDKTGQTHAQWQEEERAVDFDVQGNESYCHSKYSEGDMDQEEGSQGNNEPPESEIEEDAVSRTDCNDEAIGETSHGSNDKSSSNVDNESEVKMQELHQLMSKRGMKKSAALMKDCLSICQEDEVKKSGKNSKGNVNLNANKLPIADKSEEMIYRWAVKKRGSSSSEEEVNTSDEFLDNLNSLLISERRRSKEINASPYPSDGELDQSEGDLGNHDNVEPSPGTSCDQMSPEEKADQMIRDAEKSKACVFPQPGKGNGNQPKSDKGGSLDFHQLTARVDDDYMVIGGHIDEALSTKIKKGDYVDFRKLLPHDQIVAEEDSRMELIFKGGKAYWVPATREVSAINSFTKWEQAFRIFSNIYTREHPNRAPELIQYNHVIHTIASTYVWDNVYAYDKEFRMHLSKHPF